MQRARNSYAGIVSCRIDDQGKRVYKCIPCRLETSSKRKIYTHARREHGNLIFQQSGEWSGRKCRGMPPRRRHAPGCCRYASERTCVMVYHLQEQQPSHSSATTPHSAAAHQQHMIAAAAAALSAEAALAVAVAAAVRMPEHTLSCHSCCDVH